MDSKYQIKIGDVVSVGFNNAQSTLCHKAEVKASPAGPGDSWVFVDLETNDVHYVSEGCTITKSFN